MTTETPTKEIVMPQIHAHICENCLRGGIETVWIHGDIDRGNVQAHKCPKCGTVEWKKFLVPVGQLPAAAKQAVQVIQAMVTLPPMEYAFLMAALMIAIFGLCVAAVEIWKKRKVA